MLAEELKPKGFGSAQKESWGAYSKRMALARNSAIRSFYRQVVYDHFTTFNEVWFPEFQIHEWKFDYKMVTPKFLFGSVNYWRNRPMSDYKDQFYEFTESDQSEWLFDSLKELRTWPFPIIVMDTIKISPRGDYDCGRPFHLIEGCRRYGFVWALSELGIVEDDSEHQIVLVS